MQQADLIYSHPVQTREICEPELGNKTIIPIFFLTLTSVAPSGVWPVKPLKAVNIALHKGMKTIYNLPYRTPSLDLYEDFRELDVISLRIFQNCIFMRKLHYEKTPHDLYMYFHCKETVTGNTYTLDQSDYYIKPSRLTIPQQCHIYMAPMA